MQTNVIEQVINKFNNNNKNSFFRTQAGYITGILQR